MTLIRSLLLSVVACGLLLIAPAAAIGAHSDSMKQVNGMSIHLGVVPARLLAEHPDQLPPGHPVRMGANDYHVVLAVFDSKTGQRITDAEIKASMAQPTASGKSLRMEPKAWAGAVTYCNYFKMKAKQDYDVRVDITHPNYGGKATVHFSHQSF